MGKFWNFHHKSGRYRYLCTDSTVCWWHWYNIERSEFFRKNTRWQLNYIRALVSENLTATQPLATTMHQKFWPNKWQIRKLATLANRCLYGFQNFSVLNCGLEMLKVEVKESLDGRMCSKDCLEDANLFKKNKFVILFSKLLRIFHST